MRDTSPFLYSIQLSSKQLLSDEMFSSPNIYLSKTNCDSSYKYQLNFCVSGSTLQFLPIINKIKFQQPIALQPIQVFTAERYFRGKSLLSTVTYYKSMGI